MTGRPLRGAPAGRARTAAAPWELLLLAAGTPLLRWLIVLASVPAGQPWRRACEGCGGAVGLAPVDRAAVLPHARCGHCGRRIGGPPWLVEGAAALFVAVAVVSAPAWPVLLAALWWSGCAVVLLFVDARVHQLPDRVTGAAVAGVVLLLVVDAALSGRWDRLEVALLSGAAAGGMFLLIVLLLGNRGLGLGDAKLIVSVAVLTGWWGWGAAFGAVFLGFLGAGLVGSVLLAGRRVQPGTSIAMGPFFIVGALVMLALLAWSGAR